MADRGTESEPLAPRRSLGKTSEEQSAQETAAAQKPARTRRPKKETSGSTGTAGSTSARPADKAATSASDSTGSSSSARTKPVIPPAESTTAAGPGSSESTTGKAPVGERMGSALTKTGENLKAVTANAAAAAQAAAAPTPSQNRPVRRTRRARLRLVRLDPWSVMKTAFLLSIAFGVVTVVAVGIVWGVLGAAGVWESINSTVQQVIGGDSKSTFDVQDYLGTSRVMGFTMLVAVVDVILITAIATLTAFLYNLAAALLGGVEMTLAEDDR